MKHKMLLIAAMAALIPLAAGCSGADGTDGANGTNGTDGTPGAAGNNGTDAVDDGTIMGTVKDGAGAFIDGVTVTTTPASSSGTSDASGVFSLIDVPIGVYAVTASKTGYEDFTLAGVGIGAGSTTNISLTLVPAQDSAVISGTVSDAVGGPVLGAIVGVDGQTVTATTDATGAFTLTGVTAGPVFVNATPPAGSMFLPTEDREAVWASGGKTVTGVALTFSSRQSDTATYVGPSVCGGCHADNATGVTGSAHHRSLARDTSRMRYLSTMWPAVGATIDPVKTGVSPLDGTTVVSIYLCQNSAGAYAMKFGGTANCMDTSTGTLVPVSGTYGGEGNGGIDNIPNVGVFKQRFFAKLADVPAAASWTYTAGKDKDYLVLPVQITESGNAISYGGYHGSNWATRGRTFSKKCAGCHNSGLKVEWDSSNNVTSYDYDDFNVGCENCHGPGSDHVAASSADKPLHILTPNNFTAAAERQLCGACHAADAGKSNDPDGGFGYPYNAANAALVGGGVWVPGVYDLIDYIKGYGVSTEASADGGFHSWPDQKHGLAHRQQEAMLNLSVHTNNPYDKLTCGSCHDNHSLQQGPGETVEEAADGSEIVYSGLTFRNNMMCLACHATHGPYANVSKTDVAMIFANAGGTVTKGGTQVTPTAADVEAAYGAIAGSVTEHMQETAGMGLAAYTPLDDALPVGRCSSCHMPKTAKSGGWTMGVDAQGKTALVEGDQSSHVFDIIWPYESSFLKKPSGGADTDIMPNSCGACHEGSRVSGD